MGKIVIYKGQSAYDVLRIFADELGKAFESLGKEVQLVDLLAKNVNQQLQDAFSQPCEFVFSFNAMAIDLQANGKSLYDYLNVPFVAALVDDPVYHLQRLEQRVENLIIACFDYLHMNFINSYYGGQKSCFFFPAAGCKAYTAEGEYRNIDLLFAGSYQDPDAIRNEWLKQSSSLAKLLDDIAEYILSKNYINLAMAADEVLASKGIYLGSELSNKIVHLLPLVDKYVRSRRRQECLKVLSASGLKVDIYCNNIEQLKLKEKNNFKINKPVGFLELLKLMQQSKMVLNIDPNIAKGNQERVPSTMLNGAVAVSNTNAYYLEEFEDENDILLYSWTDLDKLPDKIYKYLKNDEKREAIRLAGKQKAEEKHTWTARAKKILETVEMFKLLKSIKIT